jgi:hypothetical protein
VGRLLLFCKVWISPFWRGEGIFTSGDLRLHDSKGAELSLGGSLEVQHGLGGCGNNLIPWEKWIPFCLSLLLAFLSCLSLVLCLLLCARTIV